MEMKMEKNILTTNHESNQQFLILTKIRNDPKRFLSLNILINRNTVILPVFQTLDGLNQLLSVCPCQSQKLKMLNKDLQYLPVIIEKIIVYINVIIIVRILWNIDVIIIMMIIICNTCCCFVIILRIHWLISYFLDIFSIFNRL